MKAPAPVATMRERGAEARRNARGGVGFSAEGRPFRDGVFSFTWTDAQGTRHAALATSYDEAAEFLTGFNDWGDPAVKGKAA